VLAISLLKNALYPAKSSLPGNVVVSVHEVTITLSTPNVCIINLPESTLFNPADLNLYCGSEYLVPFNSAIYYPPLYRNKKEYETVGIFGGVYSHEKLVK